jgi:4-hydroxythreonine-4-phosphate dehydrogenase
MRNTPLLIGLALGDPSGIGPEVALKAALEVQSLRQSFRLVLAGSRSVAENTIERLGIAARIQVVSEPEEALKASSALPLLDMPDCPIGRFEFGKANPTCAHAATEWVTILVKLALERRIAALACAPVSKEALLMSGSESIGHTELVARLCGIDDYAMFLTSPRLAVMSVTGHIPLTEVVSQVTLGKVIGRLRLASNTFYELNNRAPRIAVCSVDPHCGEGGLLGRTDTEIVQQAVITAREEGLLVDGPISADAVFRPYILKRYDVVLGMYHDQAKVGIAALNSDNFVAYVAGAPIVRTTTTHGAAFDIAGKGIADPFNMRRTIETAAELYTRRFASVPNLTTSRSYPGLRACE